MPTKTKVFIRILFPMIVTVAILLSLMLVNTGIRAVELKKTSIWLTIAKSTVESVDWKLELLGDYSLWKATESLGSISAYDDITIISQRCTPQWAKGAQSQYLAERYISAYEQSGNIKDLETAQKHLIEADNSLNPCRLQLD